MATFVQLPTSGDGYYSYSTQERQFGTQATIDSLKSAGRKLKADLSVEIGIGDISFQDGRKMSPHASHTSGTNVDVRPLRTDGEHKPVTIADTAYSQDRTKKLVEILKQDSNLKEILFNDKKIAGVTSFTGHDNHLHLKYKK